MTDHTFQFDPERIERLVVELAPIFSQVRTELEAFAGVLEQIAGTDRD